jgi:hypothetical protein
MTTCKNRAWQAAQSALIWEQGVAGSNPAVPTTSSTGQRLSPADLGERPPFGRRFRATSVPLGGSAERSAGRSAAAWTSSSRAAAMAWSRPSGAGHGTAALPPRPRGLLGTTSLRAAACGGRPRPARPNCGLAAITCSKLGRSYSTYYLIARHFKLPIRFMNNINQIDLTTRDSCLSHSDYSPVPR